MTKQEQIAKEGVLLLDCLIDNGDMTFRELAKKLPLTYSKMRYQVRILTESNKLKRISNIGNMRSPLITIGDEY